MVKQVNTEQLEEDISTWKMFIEIMQDEYYTMKVEINNLISHKKLKTEILKFLETLQTNILENEKKLVSYKKSLNTHYEDFKNNSNVLKSEGLLQFHQSLLKDEENIKNNLVELKKSFSEFIHLLHDQNSI